MMTKNDRRDVWNTGANKGMYGSSSTPNKQTDGFNVIKHIGINRTNINGNTVFGSKAAKDRINGL